MMFRPMILAALAASAVWAQPPGAVEVLSQPEPDFESGRKMHWFNRDPEYLKMVDDVKSGARVAPTMRELAKVVESEATCTARLNRFKEMDVTAAAKKFTLREDPDFPASEISIAPVGATCGDTAQGISNACSRYDHWVDMKTASKTMFGTDTWHVFDAATNQPAPADVAQGEMGTCYFLAAILSIAHTRPEIIKSMFTRTELWAQNIVTTKWLIGGMETMVEVDTTIPFSTQHRNTWFTKPTTETQAWWPSILEKTWSKIFTSYHAAESGLFSMAAGAMTRAPITDTLHRPIYNAAAGTQDVTKVAALWELLKKATASKWPMGAGTASNTPFGIADGHAYSVLEAIEDSGLYGTYCAGGKVLKIMNPWNTANYNGAMVSLSPDQTKTGIFLMTYPEFLETFDSSTVAKVEANYHVTSSELTSTKNLQGAYKFTVTQDKPFVVSVVWPSHRMMQPCTALNPRTNVLLEKFGSPEIMSADASWKTGGTNAAIAEADGGTGGYRVAVSIRFPVKNYIRSAYLNIYAAESVDLYAADTAFPKLALGMVGKSVGGNPCDVVTFSDAYWTPNYQRVVGGLPTYSGFDHRNAALMAYWYAQSSQWFVLSESGWVDDGSKYGWSGAQVTKANMECGCMDAKTVTGWGGPIECGDDVLPPTSAPNGQGCADNNVKASCPVTCGVEACKAALPSALPQNPAPAPSGSVTQGPSPVSPAPPTTTDTPSTEAPTTTQAPTPTPSPTTGGPTVTEEASTEYPAPKPCTTVGPPDTIPPTTAAPSGTTDAATTEEPSGTTNAATTEAPSGTTDAATTEAPTGANKVATTETPSGTTEAATTEVPSGTTNAATTKAPSGTTDAATTEAPTGETDAATTEAPSGTMEAATTEVPSGTTDAATTEAPSGTTDAATTEAPSGTTVAATTEAPSGTTEAPTTEALATETPTSEAPAEAMLSVQANSGESSMQVNDQTVFSVGEVIDIDAGTPIYEVKTIVGIGSIILDSPLQFNHTVGSSVKSQVVNPVPPTVNPVDPCAPATAAPVNPCPVVVAAPVSPCAVPVVAAAPVSPCAVASGGYATLFDGENKADKKSHTNPFTLLNMSMFGFCALCIGALALGVKKMNRSTSTGTYKSMSHKVAASGSLAALESGSQDLLFDAPLE